MYIPHLINLHRRPHNPIFLVGMSIVNVCAEVKFSDRFEERAIPAECSKTGFKGDRSGNGVFNKAGDGCHACDRSSMSR